MFNSRRRFFSKELIRLAGSNKIDEEQLVARIKKSYKGVEKIDDELDLKLRNPKYKLDDEAAQQLDEFRYGIKDLLFVLDGLLFEVGGKEHVVLSWAKAYANAFDKTCQDLLKMLEHPEFLKSVLNSGLIKDTNDSVEQLRKCIAAINSDYGDLQMIRRTELEEETLWNQYTQDVAEDDEELLHSDVLKNYMRDYMNTYYYNSGNFEDIFLKSGLDPSLKPSLTTAHQKTCTAILEYLRFNGRGGNASSATRLAMKNAISRLMGNSKWLNTYRDKPEFENWWKYMRYFYENIPSV